MFSERTEFEFAEKNFEVAYAELEAALYAGCSLSTVIAPLLGVALPAGTTELPLGEGLSIVPGTAVPDAPPAAVWGTDGHEDQPLGEPQVLAVLSIDHDSSSRSPMSLARVRFRRLLTAIRLFERGGYAMGPLAWMRTDGGPWRPATLASGGRPRLVTLIGPEHAEELRAFCHLISRRLPSGGEVAWALSRYEMACERLAPFEALTDLLLALRALLEPEGPASGRLAQRLAALCAPREARAQLAERTAHAISLERAVIAGLAPAESGADALVEEMAEHLRALLRDVLCGHLDSDVRTLADELLGEAAREVDSPTPVHGLA
jgi:hypothetical protein